VSVRTEIPARIVLSRRGVTPSSRWMSLIRIIVSAIYVVAQVFLARPFLVEGQWWWSSSYANTESNCCLFMFERGTFCAWIGLYVTYLGSYSVVNQFRKVCFGYSAKLMLITL